MIQVSVDKKNLLAADMSKKEGEGVYPHGRKKYLVVNRKY